MDVRDLFLDQHAAMHSAAVGGNKMSAAERTFAGLTDEQMRVRPRELQRATLGEPERLAGLVGKRRELRHRAPGEPGERRGRADLAR